MKLGLFLFEKTINDFNQFLSIKNDDKEKLFKERKFWLENHFSYAGEGDARIVFNINKTKVIKLTKNKPYAKEQTINEIKVFKCFGSKFVPIIYDFAKDFSWIISEKVTPFKTNKELIENFQIAVGISKEKWNELKSGINSDSLVLILLLKEKPEVKNLVDYLKETSPWFTEFIHVLNKCDVTPSDVNEDNAGITSDGRFVILDTGGFEIAIEEQNAVGMSNISGYTSPLGAAGVGSSSNLEKGFWRDKAGKKVKTGSPELDKDIKETIQAVGTPNSELNMIQGLWQDKRKEKTKTENSELYESTWKPLETFDNENLNLKELFFIDLYSIIEEETKSLMNKMGYKFVGKNYRLGSDTYIQKDDPNPKDSKKYIKTANKNINKGKWGTKDTLHNPPAIGVSLPKKMQG